MADGVLFVILVLTFLAWFLVIGSFVAVVAVLILKKKGGKDGKI